jgi:hypothetical protein
METISEEPREERIKAFNSWLDKMPKPNEWNRMYGHHFKSFEAGREHERTLANSQLSEKQKTIDSLERWKKDYFSLWNPIDEYVRNLPEMKVGESVSAKALEILKTIDELKQFIQEVADWEEDYSSTFLRIKAKELLK